MAVIGGGMTAIDAAVQSKKLGAENVTIVYRRGQQQMPASRDEQRFAQQHGVLRRVRDDEPAQSKFAHQPLQASPNTRRKIVSTCLV